MKDKGYTFSEKKEKEIINQLLENKKKDFLF